MEPRQLAETRYDVFLSAHGRENLFHQQGAENVVSFLRNYLVDKIDTTWREKGGLGRLSVFWEEEGVVETCEEVLQALLQARGGGLLVCLITEKYLSNNRCAMVLEKAAKLFHKESSERAHLLLIGLNLDAENLRQHDCLTRLGLENVRVFPVSSNETDGPGVLATQIAESVIQRLMDHSVVAGKRIEDSFSALLEVVDAHGPRVDTLATRLQLNRTFSSRLEALQEALRLQIISAQDVKKLEESLESDTGLQYVTSYQKKWLDDWTGKSWDTLEALEAVKGWIRDFSTVPENEKFVVAEGLPSVRKLLDAVLDGSSGGAVHVIGACGSSGTGKTTACTIVANDPKVRTKFRDGVFWIGLGMNTTAEAVIEKLVKVLKSCGGFQVAKAVESFGSQKFKDAVSRAGWWLSSRRTLIVLDNVWPEEEGGRPINWIGLLRPLVGANGCLLFSTRFDQVANFAYVKKVDFGPLKDASSAVSIFRKHLGLAQDDPRHDSVLCDRIVERCKGLPLALSSAARLVQWSDYQWEEVANDLGQEPATAGPEADAGEYSGLKSIIDSTLARLEKKEFAGRLIRLINGVSCTYSWSTMYYSLAVLPKSSSSMPVAMLALLWEVRQEEAKRAAQVFCDLGLGSMIRKDVLKLHDMQLEYCCHRCVYQSLWHEHLVRLFPYLSNPNKENNSMGDEDIINTLISTDCPEYMVENAVRHMALAYEKLFSLVRQLLTDYRWMRKKAELRSLMSVVADYELVVNKITEINEEKQSHGSDLEGSRSSSVTDELEGYAAIRDALRQVPYEASPALVKGKLEQDACPIHGEGGDGYPDSGLAWQLVGRLGFRYGAITSRSRFDAGGATTEGSLEGRNLAVAELLESVDKNAVGPWIRPVTDVFGDSEIKRIIPCGGDWVRSVALSNDDKFVYSGNEDGIVRRHDLKSGRLVAELRGHTASVRSVAVAVDKSEDGSDIVFSGSDDSTIRVWSMSLMRCIATLEGHTEGVTSIAVFRDGERLISGSDDKTVRVWIRADEGPWTSQVLFGHLDSVISVALSPSGREIASTSLDRTVRIWREACSSGSSCLGERRGFEAAKSLSVESLVCDLTFSLEENEPEVILAGDGVWVWDGNSQGPSRVIGAGLIVFSVALLDRPEGMVIFGACYDGIRLWRLDNGSAVRIFSGDSAIRIAISTTRDGGRVACGLFEGAIEVWSVGACDEQETILRQSAQREGEPDGVLTHVAASEDRCKVVTVYNLQNIEIWSVEDGSRVQQAQSEFYIEHIAISANGSRIVTADWSGQIVCWNGISGNIENTWKVDMSRLVNGRTVSISLSRNGLYLAVADLYHVEIWNTEAQKLEAEAECHLSSRNAFNGLTAYAKKHGLDSESYPVEQCGSNPIPGFFLSYSPFAVYVARRKPASISSTESSSNMCSCTSTAMVDFCLSFSEVWMLPYVRGLDTSRSRAEAPLGMIAVKKVGSRDPRIFFCPVLS